MERSEYLPSGLVCVLPPRHQPIAAVTGRWVHKESGRSYHTKFAPPKVPGVDDVTGEPLMQRSDDKPDTVHKRLESFHKQTAPVLDYYR